MMDPKVEIWENILKTYSKNSKFTFDECIEVINRFISEQNRILRTTTIVKDKYDKLLNENDVESIKDQNQHDLFNFVYTGMFTSGRTEVSFDELKKAIAMQIGNADRPLVTKHALDLIGRKII